jgi:hypothetical protein
MGELHASHFMLLAALLCCINLHASHVLIRMQYAVHRLDELQSCLHTSSTHCTTAKCTAVAFVACVGSSLGAPRRGMMLSQLVVLQKCPRCRHRSCMATCRL